MSYRFSQQKYNYLSSRFQDDCSECNQLPEDKGLTLSFFPDSEILLKKAIKAVIKDGSGKVLPLQGIVDLETGQIFLGALTPRDENAFVFNEEPLIEHKKAGLFDCGDYCSRMESYQRYYSEGPTAHQQMLRYAKGRAVTVDDCENTRGIAINIRMENGEITINIDGKSLSINQTAQYLRTKHEPGYTLSKHEADNRVLKSSGEYSDMCEPWIYKKISAACKKSIQQFSQDKSPFFSKATGMPVSGEHLTDESMAEYFIHLKK